LTKGIPSITDDGRRGLTKFAADQEDGDDDGNDSKSTSNDAPSDGGGV
jgi:hypothetical protein